jgi:hypothetical protein
MFFNFLVVSHLHKNNKNWKKKQIDKGICWHVSKYVNDELYISENKNKIKNHIHGIWRVGNDSSLKK